jgi:hypothetical protein
VTAQVTSCPNGQFINSANTGCVTSCPTGESINSAGNACVPGILQTFSQIQASVGSSQFKLMFVTAGSLREAWYNNTDQGIYAAASGTLFNFSQPANIYGNQIAICVYPYDKERCLRHNNFLVWGQRFLENDLVFAWKFYMQSDGTYLIVNDYNNPTYLGVTNGRLKIVPAGDSTIVRFFFCRQGYLVNSAKNACVQPCPPGQLLDASNACASSLFYSSSVAIPSTRTQITQVQVPKDYTLSFVITLNSYNTTANSFNMIIGLHDPAVGAGSIAQLGGRMPFVWIYQQKVYVSFGSFTGVNYNHGIVSNQVVPLNTPTIVHIVAVGSNYEIFYNSVSVGSNYNDYANRPRAQGLANWFLGWNGVIGVSVADASISNLVLSEGKQIPPCNSDQMLNSGKNICLPPCPSGQFPNPSMTACQSFKPRDCDYVKDAWEMMSGSKTTFTFSSTNAGYCCDFTKGITCSGSNVVEIAWIARGLSGNIPSTLGYLTSLTKLYV